MPASTTSNGIRNGTIAREMRELWDVALLELERLSERRESTPVVKPANLPETVALKRS